MNIQKRCFIVGCSRSGTTLLQRILAGHSEIHTFPETGVFLKAWGMRRSLPFTGIGLTSGREKKVLRKLYANEQGAECRYGSQGFNGLLNHQIAHAITSLDALAAKENKYIWVEKTPRHFLHAKRISKHVPEAFVFHTLRDGIDVVASIIDRSKKFPRQFARQDIQYAIRLWNKAVHKQAQYFNKEGHYFIAYQHLAAQPERYAQAICQLLDIRYETCMINRPEDGDNTHYVRKEESWKSGVSGHIRPAKSKADSLFSKAEQQDIRRILTAYPSYERMLHQLESTANQPIAF